MRASAPLSASSQPAASLGTRLALIGLAALVLVFGMFAFAISQSSLHTLEANTQSAMHDQEAAMRDMIGLFDGTMRTEADRFLTAFADAAPGPYSVDPAQTVEIAGKPTPTFRSGDTVLNLNFSVPDKFFARTGGTIATVFARTGDDFVRVTTSLKKENGERAIGTLLDRAHPSYKALMAGEPFRGLAWLFGVPYMSKYEPVRDASGKVIGALYVGVDVRSELALLKDKIRAHGIGKTGGYFVIDGKPGAEQGKVLIDRNQAREGKNLIDVKDAGGLAWVREMIERKEGTLRHTLADTEGGPARERFTVFTQYPDWKLVIAGTAYVDELEADLISARNRFLLLGLALGALLAGGLYWMLRRAVSAPLAEVVNVAQRVAAGDLTHRLPTARRDEIGQLMRAINGVGDGLTGIVDKVRASASTIASSTGQIAAGNADSLPAPKPRPATSSARPPASKSWPPLCDRTPTAPCTRTTWCKPPAKRRTWAGTRWSGWSAPCRASTPRRRRLPTSPASLTALPSRPTSSRSTPRWKRPARASRAAALPWWLAKCAASRSAARPPPRRSRRSSTARSKKCNRATRLPAAPAKRCRTSSRASSALPA